MGGLWINRLNVPGTSRPQLTEREQDVLALMAAGLSNKEIAGKLVTSETVKAYVRNIFTKMNVNRRVTAVMEAKKRDLLP